MAVSLKPCPACGKPMDAHRAVCVFCQQAPPPAPPQGPASAPTIQVAAPRMPIIHDPDGVTPWLFFVVAALFPPFGLVSGVVYAFDPEPRRKQRAGHCFGGMLVGAVAYTILPFVLVAEVFARHFGPH